MPIGTKSCGALRIITWLVNGRTPASNDSAVKTYLRLVDSSRLVAIVPLLRVSANAATCPGRIRDPANPEARGDSVAVFTRDVLVGARVRSAELVALDDLERSCPQIASNRVVELRFFGGLNIDETGGTEGLQETVKRD